MGDTGVRSGESGNKGFFSRLSSGEFGLAKTYWLYGVVIGVALNMALKVVTSLGVLAVALVAVTLYQVMVLLGIWRAASRYLRMEGMGHPSQGRHGARLAWGIGECGCVHPTAELHVGDWVTG